MESKRLFTFRIRHYSSKITDETDEQLQHMTAAAGASADISTPFAPIPTPTAENFDFDFDPKANIKKARMKKIAVAATAATAATAVVRWPSKIFIQTRWLFNDLFITEI